MMKTLRTSSYLRHVARHHDSNLPLLKPPHTLTQRWRTMPPHDRATEMTLSAQHPSARTGTTLLLQEPAPLSMQHTTKLQPALPTTKTVQPVTGQEATSPSSTQSSRLHAPVAPSDSSPVTEELSPTKSTLSVAAETSRAPGEKTPASIILRPLSRQQQEATIPSTNSRHAADFAGQENNASTRDVEPQRRSAVLPHKQGTQQHTAIHIGTIDIHIVPPAPPVPLPPARGAALRPSSTPALSREMTSFIGLRQG